MARRQMTPRPAFAGLMNVGRHGAPRDAAGVVARELAERSLVHVEARQGRTHEVAGALVKALDLAAAPTPRALARRGGVTMAWAGPGIWTIASDEARGALAKQLEAAIGATASVVDQSDGRAALRLSGRSVRKALSKGVPIDLDRRVFPPGSVALTKLSHLAVQLWHVGDEDTFELIVPRTAAGDVWHWLEASAAEFGLEVEP